MSYVKKSRSSNHKWKWKISYAERDLKWVFSSDHLQNQIVQNKSVPAERVVPLTIPFFRETSKKHWKIKR